MQEEQYLSDFFKNYYSRANIPIPSEIERREFGYGTFGNKIAQRHLSFGNENDFKKFLVGQVPFYVSCSAAFYRYPERRPMQAKEFLKAEIVYEFDADDLATECKAEHDSWSCPSCGTKGKGAQTNCTNCGAHVLQDQWVCEKCLDETKRETIRLLKLINSEFGISEGITVNFSGHKGYHIHIHNKDIENLSATARIEMLDYLTAHNFDLVSRGYFYDSRAKEMHCPAFDIAKGWDRKILNGIIGLFSAENAEELSIAGNIRLSDAKKMLSAKDDVLHGMKSGRLISMRSKKSDEFWAGIINYIISKDKFLVDRQTSSDITKVIRVPDTIHGGTGLLAKTIPIDELKDFNPLRDAVIESKKETKIRALASYDFDFLGRKFSFIEKEPAELPESVAVYLLAKGKAELEQ